MVMTMKFGVFVQFIKISTDCKQNIYRGDRTSGPMLPKHCKTDSLNDLVDDVIHVADDRIFSSVNPNQSVNHNQSEQSAKYLLVMVFNPFLHLRFKVIQCGFILSTYIYPPARLSILLEKFVKVS